MSYFINLCVSTVYSHVPIKMSFCCRLLEKMIKSRPLSSVIKEEDITYYLRFICFIGVKSY